MLLIKLDEKGLQPKYLQILEQVRQKIESRVLRPGEKLPSTRRLAEKLEVHRSTVATAYQELWALGFVDLRPGACPRVRDRMQIITASGRKEKGVIRWNMVASPAGNAIRQDLLGFHPAPPGTEKSSIINFSSLDMDDRLFPLEHFRSCLNRVLKRQGPRLLVYGDRAGFLPLREYLARRLESHGISARPDEILLTNGSQHGLDLVFRMIATPGRAVAIESPTYDHILPLLRFCGLRPIEIPVRRDGMDLSALRRSIEKERPVLVYTMPTFQNPTGTTTNQAHREELLSLCETHRLPLLEDGFEEEMKYFGRTVLPVKSMDRHGLVVYCGTFSKVLFPGIRVGWVVAEKECIERLTAIRRFSELSSSMILQAALHDFCRNGFYDRHISRMHRVFRKRMQAAVEALRRHIRPEWAEWSEPSGGYLLWLKLKKPASSSLDWPSLLASHGARAAHGRHYFFSGTRDTYLRLSISTLNEEEITEGIRRLSNAMREAYGRRQP